MSEALRVELDFKDGTIRVRGLDPTAELPASLTRANLLWDPRTREHRARAIDYRALVLALRAEQIVHDDKARGYAELGLSMRVVRTPYPHQKEAIEAWLAGSTSSPYDKSRGVVVLPTGAGKTFVAAMAILAKKRSTLVIVPTLDLLAQWAESLRSTFSVEIGMVGGGSFDVRDITVTTYDSAYLHMDRLGNRFGLVVFDECHHLPSEAYATAAEMSLAPFRLGLTATPERTDGRDSLYEELIGPIVYRRDINQLSGHYLAPYETRRIAVPLSDEERAAYESARAEYVGFIRATGIDMSAPDGWGQFLLRSSLSDTGRRAFQAYRTQKRLALAAPGKLAELERLLAAHRADRVIVFTEDNATVHEISRRMLLPPITHQTKVRERADILAAFAEGRLFAIVTSKVLNEGVDVPSANVAIVLSGSGSVREHVQRLGRILRKDEGKRATLYELVSLGTNEQRVSDRRREHVAYK